MTNNQFKIHRPWLKPRKTIPTQVTIDPQLDLVRNMIPRDRLDALTETSPKGHLELLLLRSSQHRRDPTASERGKWRG
ncbi:hypothetical protein SCLCIDRAFT_347535 [Scleroderma citrinum Foug A]|uniref:Uncharacterized protein n=1 Tax=Scleroderma citrinum Foug A TaxID=1036808 RepID=A0A0C3D1G4_9AGAM|nr:hypothetical protein SCLCIDRAFT_347535 [Scleroderma citrinum Foug A]